MATGIEGWLYAMIYDGHRKFMVHSEFWKAVAEDYAKESGINIEVILGDEIKTLDEVV